MGFISDLKDKLDFINVFDTIGNSRFIKEKPVLNAIVNNPLVDDYFQRPLDADTKADASFEKKIAVATAKAASQYLGWDKEKSKQAAMASADFVREVRRVYQYQQKLISEKEYNQHKEVSWWARLRGVAKATWEVAKEPVKKFVKEKGFSWLLEKSAKVFPHPVVRYASKLWDIIPQPAKEAIKEGAKRLVDKAIDKVPVLVQNVSECAKTVAQKAVKIIEKGIEKAKEIDIKIETLDIQMVSFARTVIKAGMKTVKSVGEKVLNWLGV